MSRRFPKLARVMPLVLLLVPTLMVASALALVSPFQPKCQVSTDSVLVSQHTLWAASSYQVKICPDATFTPLVPGASEATWPERSEAVAGVSGAVPAQSSVVYGDDCWQVEAQPAVALTSECGLDKVPAGAITWATLETQDSRLGQASSSAC